MKTPQRKAPKLVFTPLRPIQPIVPPSIRSSPEAVNTTKDIIEESKEVTLEGVVLSPADSSFRQAYIQESPVTRSLPEPEREDTSDDISDVSLVLSASASPATVFVDIESINLVPDDDGQESEVLSPIQLITAPRRQTKKRVVYSSDEDSQDPAPRIPSPQARANKASDIEVIGESTLPRQSQVDQIGPGTQPTKATRTKHKKTTNNVSKFIDMMARAAGRDSEDDDSDDAGSLNDFIVDDDYIEYENEDSNDEDAYVLTYSPTTPKPKKRAPPITSVTVDLTGTSDEEDVDPIPSVAAAPRPKARPRAAPAKAVPTETPKKSRTEKKTWNDNKQKLAMDIMEELDELVFEDKLVKEWKVAPVWNNKLLTTAGRAHHKRSVLRVFVHQARRADPST